MNLEQKENHPKSFPWNLVQEFPYSPLGFEVEQNFQVEHKKHDILPQFLVFRDEGRFSEYLNLFADTLNAWLSVARSGEREEEVCENA